MAAVFMISTSTLLAQGGLAPRLLALAGYAIGALLLIFVATITWIELLFPAWVARVSLHILRRGRLYTPPTAATQALTSPRASRTTAARRRRHGRFT